MHEAVIFSRLVCQLTRFSQETTDRVFLKFHIKLEALNFQNLRKSIFFQKNWHFGEKAPKSPKK